MKALQISIDNDLARIDTVEFWLMVKNSYSLNFLTKHGKIVV